MVLCYVIIHIEW